MSYDREGGDSGYGGRSGGRGGFGGRRGGYSSGPREMHDATCSACGATCQVPFKPAEGRPVYCRDCYAKNRPPRNDSY